MSPELLQRASLEKSPLGKNLKKLKMRKIQILWYLCQKSSRYEFNTFNIVKFDSRLVSFSYIFQFQNTFVPKKLNLCFCDNSVKINCQNFDKTWWFRQHSWWIKNFPEIIRFFLVFMYPIRFIKLYSKLFFWDYKCLFLSPQKKREFRTQASVSSGQMDIFWKGLYQLNGDWYWIPKQC